MTNQEFVFVVLFIIFVYVAFKFYGQSNLVSGLLLVCGAAMFVLGYKIYSGKTKEQFVLAPHPPTLVRPDNIPDSGDLSESIELSKYGNINSDEVDYMGQTDVKNLTFNHSTEIDNGDIFEEVFSGDTMYSPAEAYSRDFYNIKDREWYTKFFQKPQNIVVPSDYSIPLNEGGTNADAGLARRQMFRGEINKKAIDGMVRSTRNLNERLYTHELAENYAREWVSDQGDDVMGGTETTFF